jgi:hypothetical protein
MMKEDINEIEKLAIMVDADEDGYLLQIFWNQYKIDQPCFEIIQRMGAKVLVQETLKHFWVNWENSNCEERYKKTLFFYMKNNQ